MVKLYAIAEYIQQSRVYTVCSIYEKVCRLVSIHLPCECSTNNHLTNLLIRVYVCVCVCAHVRGCGNKRDKDTKRIGE